MQRVEPGACRGSDTWVKSRVGGVYSLFLGEWLEQVSIVLDVGEVGCPASAAEEESFEV